MKKRLLALALCLVLATSLLPITAAAAFPSDSVMYSWAGGIKNGGIYCGDIYITDASPEGFRIDNVRYTKDSYFYTVIPDSGQWKLDAGLGTIVVQIYFFDISPGDTALLHYDITINSDHTWSAWTSNGDGTHSRTCSNGCVESPQTKDCADTNPADCKCDDCGASMHNWQFKASGNELTGYCGGANCDIKEVSVSLKADSVTLPTSPFETAQLVGWEAFKKAVPNAVIGDLVYKYNGPDGWNIVEPTAANAKAGEYQVGVRITIPCDNIGDSQAGWNQGNEIYDLFVKYTAVDPAVTAQTGDNRPIELMVGSVVVFSALAAAAFIADSKRRTQQ